MAKDNMKNQNSISRTTWILIVMLGIPIGRTIFLLTNRWHIIPEAIEMGSIRVNSVLSLLLFPIVFLPLSFLVYRQYRLANALILLLSASSLYNSLISGRVSFFILIYILGLIGLSSHELISLFRKDKKKKSSNPASRLIKDVGIAFVLGIIALLLIIDPIQDVQKASKRFIETQKYTYRSEVYVPEVYNKRENKQEVSPKEQSYNTSWSSSFQEIASKKLSPEEMLELHIRGGKRRDEIPYTGSSLDAYKNGYISGMRSTLGMDKDKPQITITTSSPYEYISPDEIQRQILLHEGYNYNHQELRAYNDGFRKGMTRPYQVDPEQFRELIEDSAKRSKAARERIPSG